MNFVGFVERNGRYIRRKQEVSFIFSYFSARLLNSYFRTLYLIFMLPCYILPILLIGYFLCNRWKEDEEPTYEFVTPMPPPLSTSNNPTEGRNAANAQQDLSTNSVTRSLTSNTYGTSLHAARTAREDTKLMARLIFYYGRWTAQKESSILETKMASTLRMRLKMMAIFALKESENIGFELDTFGISFVNGAFTKLLECRSFLQHSYAHAYIFSFGIFVRG